MLRFFEKLGLIDVLFARIRLDDTDMHAREGGGGFAAYGIGLKAGAIVAARKLTVRAIVAARKLTQCARSRVDHGVGVG